VMVYLSNLRHQGLHKGHGILKLLENKRLFQSIIHFVPFHRVKVNILFRSLIPLGLQNMDVNSILAPDELHLKNILYHFLDFFS